MNEDQAVRVEALQAAAPLVQKRGGPFGPTTPPDTTDLIDVAMYIIDGVHPHDRYDIKEAT